MPTSSRFVVAVHALVALAVSGDKPLRSEDLAHSANTSPVVIRGLLSRLSAAGLTRSQLGAGGGALLARAAEEIRLLEVYRAVEDTRLFTLHRTPPPPDCAVGSNIVGGLQPRTDPRPRGLRGGAGPHHDRRDRRRGSPASGTHDAARMVTA
ncbi:Rrf2 family transcriptional regulator [Streptomyces sp. L7]